MLEIPTKILLLVAAVVWLAAGIGVTNVGVNALTTGWTIWVAIAFTLIFTGFFIMFLRITKRHIKRILEYKEERKSLFLFFDVQSYIIIFIMIILGAAVRISGFVPDFAIAPLYTAIGVALITCSIYYIVTFISVTDLLIAKSKDKDVS